MTYDLNDYVSSGFLNWGNGQTPFYYGGFFWLMKTKSDNSNWLCKVDLVSGAETEVKNVQGVSASFTHGVHMTAFDGISTVYMLVGFHDGSSGPPYNYGYNVSKYDMSSDTLTSLKTGASVGNGYSLKGIGVDTTTVYFAFTNENDGTSHRCTMTLLGGSFSDTSGVAINMVGFGGNMLNTNKQIYIPGAQVYTFSKDPLFVFILQDGTVAQLKFAGFFGDGTNFYYIEADGTSGTIVEKYVSSSLGVLANLKGHGIFPFRSDIKPESAISLIYGDYGNWFEAVSKMKEVV